MFESALMKDWGIGESGSKRGVNYIFLNENWVSTKKRFSTKNCTKNCISNETMWVLKTIWQLTIILVKY